VFRLRPRGGSIAAAHPAGPESGPRSRQRARLSWLETSSARPSRAYDARRGSVTYAAVSGGCDQDRREEGVDIDASPDHHMTRSAACGITRTRRLTRRSTTIRRPADRDDGARARGKPPREAAHWLDPARTSGSRPRPERTSPAPHPDPLFRALSPRPNAPLTRARRQAHRAAGNGHGRADS